MTQKLRQALRRLLRLFQPRCRRKFDAAMEPKVIVPERPAVPDDRGDSETELRVWSREEPPAFPVEAYLAAIRSCSATEWGHVCVASRTITAAWLSERTGLAVEAGPDSTSLVYARPRQGA